MFLGVKTNRGSPPVMLEIDDDLDANRSFFKALQGIKDQWTDFTLKGEDGAIACHKVVLAARSVYFQCLFKQSSSHEVAQGFVDLRTLPFHVLEMVIDYCYSGTLKCKLADAKQVIEVTDYLHIACLKDKMSSLIMEHVTVDNCMDWYFFVASMDMAKLKEKAQEVMCVDFPNVTKLPQFYALAYNDLITYITLEDVLYNSALDAACSWVMHDVKKRHEVFEGILNAIDISRCSASALKHVVKNYGSTLLTTSDLKERFFVAMTDAVDDWQIPGRGAGYDIIILGGDIDQDNCNRKCWRVNLKTGDTVEKQSLPCYIPDLLDVALCSIPSGAVYGSGAKREEDDYETVVSSSQCVLYQKASDTWELCQKIPFGGFIERAICVNDKVYFIGGSTDNYRKMVCFDLTSKTWTRCPDMPQSQQLPIMGSIDQSIYLILSTLDSNQHLWQNSPVRMDCFDTTASTWFSRASLPETVERTNGASTVTIGHRMYLVGGSTVVCVQYDSLTDQWTTLTQPLIGITVGQQCSLKGKLFLQVDQMTVVIFQM